MFVIRLRFCVLLLWRVRILGNGNGKLHLDGGLHCCYYWATGLIAM